MGGIPIAIAYVISLTSFSPTGSLPGSDSQAWRLLPSILVIFVTGLTDDFFNLRPSVKLAGQLIAAVLAFFNGPAHSNDRQCRSPDLAEFSADGVLAPAHNQRPQSD